MILVRPSTMVLSRRRSLADVERDPLNLIEALADRIALTCLRYDAVQCVEVTVHKPQAPMPVDVADVAVTLTRSKRYE